jgi:scaffold protein (connect acetoacetyl-CoA thiolase and HMG-CoA synthase)
MELPRYHRLRGALYRLEGSACRGCEARAFPARTVCAACGSRDTAPFTFSGRGILWSFARVAQAPRGFASVAPYAVGMVRLAEGPLVTAQLADAEGVDLAIGMEMEMVTRKIRDAQENGFIVYGYKFRPALRPAPQAGSAPQAGPATHAGSAPREGRA